MLPVIIFSICALCVFALFYFVGKLYSSLLCGILLSSFAMYSHYKNWHDSQFYCNKINNECVYSRNHSKNGTFKKISNLKILDIKDVAYEEKINQYRRRGRIREYTSRNIIFTMNDGKVWKLPSDFISHITEENLQTTNDIKSFLYGNNETYIIETNNKEDLPIALYIFLFLIGCGFGNRIYRVWVEPMKETNGET